ncbi:MAG: hypothetical protein ABGW77_06445 [Campylobacterales bacterium]
MTGFRQVLMDILNLFKGGELSFFELYNWGVLGEMGLLSDRNRELINCCRVIQ